MYARVQCVHVLHVFMCGGGCKEETETEGTLDSSAKLFLHSDIMMSLIYLGILTYKTPDIFIKTSQVFWKLQ